MRVKSWLRQTACALGVCGVFVGPTLGQETAPPSSADAKILERLEQLEKRNDRLEKQNQELLGKVQELATPVATEGAVMDAKSVQGIVANYLQGQAAKEKAETKKGGAPEWYQVGSDTKMPGGWSIRGMNFESAQKDFRAHLGGRIQFDNGYIGAPGDFINSTTSPGFSTQGAFDDNSFFRRIRIEFDGSAFENVEWSMEVDLERNLSSATGFNGNFPACRFDELWAGLKNLPILGNVRAGHIRVPQGLESSTSSRNLTFMERSSGFEAFLQEFDPGFLMFNYTENQRLWWAAAVHRIDRDSKGGEFGKGDVAVTGRLTGLPVYSHDGRCLVHLGASYQYHSNSFNRGSADRTFSFAAPPDFRASYFTPNFVNTGNFVSDHISTAGLELLAIRGPLSVQGEFFVTQAANVQYPAGPPVGPNVGGANFTSGYIYASYFLTGENRRYDKRLARLDRVIPLENFFCVKGEDGCWLSGSGAWEIAARYDFINLNNSTIEGGYMNNYTLGLNWYLNPNLKCQWNYTAADRTVPTTNVPGAAQGPSGMVHYLGMRVQVEF